MATRTWDSSYQDLLELVELPTLEHRRLETRLCLLYKIIHNLCYFDFDNIFTLITSLSHHASHHFVLDRPFARTNFYLYSFVPRTISLWNSLNPSTVNAPSPSSFKNSLYYPLSVVYFNHNYLFIYLLNFVSLLYHNYLFIYLFVSLLYHNYLFIYLFVSLLYHNYLFIYLLNFVSLLYHNYLFIYLFVSLLYHNYLFIYLFVSLLYHNYLFIYLFISLLYHNYLFIYLFVSLLYHNYLFIYLFVSLLYIP